MSARPSSSGTEYEILAEIGRGGMASVYVGRARGAVGFSRLVAIKRPRPETLSNEGARAALVEEARIASKIHHPNVVAVHDVVEREDGLLLVMDYVEGVSLGELMSAARGPLEPAASARIVLDVASGLAAAHELRDELDRPIHPIHRDVSPQNILVGADGTSRITDFGIAKSVAPGRESTSSNVLKGKVAYMAPEYIEGHRIDARSDVFALGVVLWEALAGRRLFRAANDTATLKRVLVDAAPSLVPSGLPPEVDAVVARALTKDPAERFASMRAFAEALEAACHDHRLLASHATIRTLVEQLAGDAIVGRRARIRAAVLEREGPGAPISRSFEWPGGLAEEVTTQRDDARTPPTQEPVDADATNETRTAMTIVDRAPMVRDDPAPRRPIVEAASTGRPPRPARRALIVGSALALLVALSTLLLPRLESFERGEIDQTSSVPGPSPPLDDAKPRGTTSDPAPPAAVEDDLPEPAVEEDEPASPPSVPEQARAAVDERTSSSPPASAPSRPTSSASSTPPTPPAAPSAQPTLATSSETPPPSPRFGGNPYE